MCISEALRLIAKGNPDMNKAMREDLKDEFKKFKKNPKLMAAYLVKKYKAAVTAEE